MIGAGILPYICLREGGVILFLYCKDGVYLSDFGGTSELNETPIATALREFKEEATDFMSQLGCKLKDENSVRDKLSYSYKTRDTYYSYDMFLKELVPTYKNTNPYLSSLISILCLGTISPRQEKLSTGEIFNTLEKLNGSYQDSSRHLPVIIVGYYIPTLSTIPTTSVLRKMINDDFTINTIRGDYLSHHRLTKCLYSDDPDMFHALKRRLSKPLVVNNRIYNNDGKKVTIHLNREDTDLHVVVDNGQMQMRFNGLYRSAKDMMLLMCPDAMLKFIGEDTEEFNLAKLIQSPNLMITWHIHKLYHNSGMEYTLSAPLISRVISRVGLPVDASYLIELLLPLQEERLWVCMVIRKVVQYGIVLERMPREAQLKSFYYNTTNERKAIQSLSAIVTGKPISVPLVMEAIIQ